jgi:hypothetical protein
MFFTSPLSFRVRFIPSIGFKATDPLFHKGYIRSTRMSSTQATPNRPSFSSLNITFLGTASAQPSSTRNHSSLALRLGGAVWLFDCGEATQHQIQKSEVKMGKIEKIFITHTHGQFLLLHVGLPLNVSRRPYFWAPAPLGKPPEWCRWCS